MKGITSIKNSFLNCSLKITFISSEPKVNTLSIGKKSGVPTPSSLLNICIFVLINRWMEVISSATQHSGRLRLFSRKESETVSPRF